MMGASGAIVRPYGDFVSKICEDAPDQTAWFDYASKIGFVPGVRVPEVSLKGERNYFMEFVRGHAATHESSIIVLETLFEQVMKWKEAPYVSTGRWDSYLQRLWEHVNLCPTKEMDAAMDLLMTAEPLPPSFCHGDFTLENILIESDGTCVLIDPNFKPDLFQSYILDLGKLLQSTHARYHEVFHSHHGGDLSRYDEWLQRKLKHLELWRPSLLACISHIIRLRKYRPEEQRPLVDCILADLVQEYERTL
jgi:hypothetical protein